MGASGSGKSVLRQRHFGADSLAALEWVPGRPLIEYFDSPRVASDVLAAVQLDLGTRGVADCAYHSLSAGQRFQAGLARVLAAQCAAAEGAAVCVVDEFTNALDRALAAALARSVRLYIDRHAASSHQRFVFVGCHDDVAAALRPDWTFTTGANRLVLPGAAPGQRGQEVRVEHAGGRDGTEQPPPWSSTANGLVPAQVASAADARRVHVGGQKGARPGAGQQGTRPGAPPVEVTVATPVVPLRLAACDRVWWGVFAEHHYKSETLSPAAQTYLVTHAQRGVPVGFVAVIRHNGAKTDGAQPFRAHRTVVLPVWQGLGIGSRMSDAVAEMYRRRASRFYGQTVHPVFGSYRDRSPWWKATAFNHTTSEYKIESWKQRKNDVRVKREVPKFVYSHEFVGPGSGEAAQHEAGHEHHARRHQTWSSRGVSFIEEEEGGAGVPDDDGMFGIEQVLAYTSSMPPSLAPTSPFQLFVDVHVALWGANKICDDILAMPSASRRKHFVKGWQAVDTSSRNQLIASFRSLRAAASSSVAPGASATPPCTPAATTGATATATATDTAAAPPTPPLGPSGGDGDPESTGGGGAAPTAAHHGNTPDAGAEQWASILARHAPGCPKGHVLTNAVARLHGRVVHRRQLSGTLLFLDIAPAGEGGSTAQVVLNKKLMPAAEQHTFDVAAKRVQIGDEIRVAGHPGRTRTGQGSDEGFSLFGTSVGISSVNLSQKRIVAILHDHQNGTVSAAETAQLLGAQEGIVGPLLTLLADHIRKCGTENEASRKRQRYLATASDESCADDGRGTGMAAGGEGLTPARQARLDLLAAQRHKHLYVVLENPTNPGNIAAVMRSCDAFGVTELLVVGGEAMRDMAS